MALKKDQIATFQNKGTDSVIAVKSFNTLNFDKTVLSFKDNSLESGTDVTFGLGSASIHSSVRKHLLLPTASFRYFLPIYLFPNTPLTTSELVLFYSQKISSPLITGLILPQYS